MNIRYPIYEGVYRILTDKRESRIYIPRWRLYVPQYILSLTENY